MNKSFLKQWIIIIVGFIVVAMVALIGGASQVQTKYNKQVVDEALESKNFDTWFSLQTFIYKHVLTYKNETETYQFSLYSTVEIREESKYEERLYLLIVPLQSVDFAENNKDDKDQTQIKIMHNTTTLLDTKEKYQGIALSYGLNPSKLGFIYDGITLDAYEELDFYVSDYNNQTFSFKIQEELTNLVSNYDEKNLDLYINTFGYNKGFTSNDLSEKFQPEINKLIVMYSSVYLGLIVLGYITFYTLKIIRTKRKDKKRNLSKDDKFR